MRADWEQLAKSGATSEELATAFRCSYFANRPITYPVNPFQMLRDTGVVFSFRPFSGYEGVYIPSDSEAEHAVVGINIDRPITRQRYTAAHELCHHLKDRSIPATLCPIGSRATIERYAEQFAAELLMPREELLRQVEQYARDGHVNFDDVLRIAVYFGVSFEACLYQLAYELGVIAGDTSSPFTEEEDSLVLAVYESFGCYSGDVLARMTHLEPPWLNARKRANAQPGDQSKEPISEEDMKEFFRGIVNSYEMAYPRDIGQYARDAFAKTRIWMPRSANPQNSISRHLAP